MKQNNAIEKNNFRGSGKTSFPWSPNKFEGGIKMEKNIKIKNWSGKTKVALVLVSFVVLAAIVFAQTVSHPAWQITTGIFPDEDFTFGTDTLHIDSSNDRVGIGTNSPGYNLEVVGNIHATGDITCVGSCGGASLWTESGSNIYRSTGNVGIGTTNPTSTLHVQGSLNVSESFNLPLSQPTTPQVGDMWLELT